MCRGPHEPRTALAESGVVLCKSELAAASRGRVLCIGETKVGTVENIEEFRAELSSVALVESPHLCYAEIDIVIRLGSESVVTGVANRSVRRRRQDTGVLNVASVVCKRCESKLLELGIARVRGNAWRLNRGKG